MHDVDKFIQTLGVVLCTAAVTTVVFQRLKQPVVLGYLLAGMIVGPHIPVPLSANNEIVQTLSELGVILLMFSLGIEFSLRKIMQVGATAGLIALVECSFMVWIGFLAAQAFGWTRLESLYAGAVIAISSTTIIVKAFGEQRIRGDFTHLVLGIVIFEDLIAILLITILTTLSAGQGPTVGMLAWTAGRLFLFLAILLVGGLFTIPRLMRVVARLERPETTVVASVGIAFGGAALAQSFGYSVALGAFLGGCLVAESGVEKTVEHLVQPIRDVFAAIFFVSVGMLIDPAQIAAHWGAVLVFLACVVAGKVFAVSGATFLTGKSVQTSIKTGMSLAQIGEFSFIIAAMGLATHSTGDFLYPIAVAVSAVTTLSTPWLIRSAEPVSKFVDRELPRPLQTFVALYGSWIEQMRLAQNSQARQPRIRNLIRWLSIDATIVAAIIIASSVNFETMIDLVTQYISLSQRVATLLVIAGVLAVAARFAVAMIRAGRVLGWELADRAFPPVAAGKLDTADAPRRLLVVTLQLAIVVLLGAPLLAITQPFLPPLSVAILWLLATVLLGLTFWRRTANFQGHARAAAEVIAAALARQMRERSGNQAESTSDALEEVNQMLSGLGSPVSVELSAASPAVGKTLAELNLRGLTGATILAIRRGSETLLVPDGRQRLEGGDVLALAGQHETIRAAQDLLQPSGPDRWQ